ncbi:MAG: hypothetical protein RPS47_04810 [Colwellia sp.]|jgi:hypothetical protein
MGIGTIIEDWSVVVLLVLIGISGTILGITWLYNESTGKNYYRKYPIAKAMDDMAKNGELRGKDIQKAINSIDLRSSKSGQVEQFILNIQKQ